MNEDLPTSKTPFSETDYGDGDFLPIPVVQLLQAQLTQEIVSKPKWYEKIKDAKISEKWKKEAIGKFTENMITYTFDQLLYYVDNFSKGKDVVYVSPVFSVYQVDELIPTELSNELKKYASKLESVPEELLDWHPGSDKQVLDLIHPSLFPLVHGKSYILDEPIDQTKTPMYQWFGKGAPKDFNLTQSEFSSKNFQWLPSDIQVSNEGKVSFLSYINNLHPYQYKSMYGVVSKILEKFIPLFEHVLSDSVNNPPLQDVDMYNLYERPSNMTDEEYDDWWDNKQPKEIEFKCKFKPNSFEKINLNGRRLQVIVKMANILLTPEKPKYEGGAWHVEGMENESIVATGIYYYDNDNITSSTLHFRQHVEEPEYEQGDDLGVETVYDLQNEGPLVQNIGFVQSQEGRCIAFPNIYQHQVAPFELVDATKNGHRKILVFFLVDPKKRILSTLDVPPQNKEWLKNYLIEMRCFGSQVPSEICELIVDFLEYPLGIEETKSDRIKLMEERKYLSSKVDEQHFLREFSLCEH